ncbi:MAG: right-handed parallel beta-helix repeat-containing protein [Acidobacteria bacterium]|nr:right-handed parallel beta-helix repeat-containing protein [Acidobacteriota bacterium]
MGLLVTAAVVTQGCSDAPNPVAVEEPPAPLAKKTGKTWTVPDVYPTIQTAIDAAGDGAVIDVGPGVYAEQVEIRGLTDVQLRGSDATITVPDGGMQGQLVKIVDSEGIVLKGFTVDGADGAGVAYGARNSGGDSDTRFYGVFMVNSSGQIVDNTIKDISWGNGVQQGLGLYVLVGDDEARVVNIRDNRVTNFQKNGITIWGPIQAKIHRNVVTGWGDTDIIAQNCMQLGGDPTMTASVTQNVISGATYTPFTWASTGILALWDNDNLRFVNNEISDTMIGIYVYPGSTSAKIINNSGSGNPGGQVKLLHLWPGQTPPPRRAAEQGES